MKRAHVQMQRRLAHQAAHPRQAWRQVTGDAQDLAREAERSAGEVYGDQRPRFRPLEHRLHDFQHLVRSARVADFPVAGCSVGFAAEAFVRLAHGFCEAGTPELRLILARALGAAAEALTEIMDEAMRLQAREFNRRQMGERIDE